MDLVIGIGVITVLYLGAVVINKLMTKIDEHEEIMNADYEELPSRKEHVL